VAKTLSGQCFLCGIDRSLFDRLERGFVYHVHSEHNVWHCAFFLIFLRAMKEHGLTGTEARFANSVCWPFAVCACALT
jgi:hypothetical protein